MMTHTFLCCLVLFLMREAESKNLFMYIVFDDDKYIQVKIV